VTTNADVEAWLERYLVAWESNDPEDIRILFTEDARYFTAPHREPWVGHDDIVAGWLSRPDDPDTWSFASEVIALIGDLAVVRGRTTYATGPDYSNLWLIEFAVDGRCVVFTEWWMPIE
jgi:hypothetical protein